MGFLDIGILATVSPDKQEGTSLCEIDRVNGKMVETFPSVHCCLLLACHSSSAKTRPNTILIVHLASTVGVVISLLTGIFKWNDEWDDASKATAIPNFFFEIREIFMAFVARGVQQFWRGTGAKLPPANRHPANRHPPPWPAPR